MAEGRVIVAGLGGMGSAAAYHLARRGWQVQGFDANPPGHDLGSSHGTSRIIRLALYEAPEYVPLVQRSYALWRELAAESGRPLLTITGRLLMGPPDSGPVQGVLRSAREHQLPLEQLDAAAVRARFPGFAPADDMVGLFEPDGGMLDPEGCVAAHLDLAARHGAELHFEEPITDWAADGAGVRVTTPRGSYQADRLVLAAGPWLPALAARLGLPLRVTRQTVLHFTPRDAGRFSRPDCPVFGLQTPSDGQYYGTPATPGVGFKIGQHDPGEPTTPETVRRTVDAAEVAHLRGVLDRYLPGSAGGFERGVVCLYTRTPDGHFILDTLPEQPQVVLISACSGHGYKYCAAIGEAVAALAAGVRPPGLDFFAAGRFAGV